VLTVPPERPPGRVVWWFDVDGCLVDALTGASLRPGAVEVLSGVRRDAAAVLLWSAGGADYARRRAEEHGIAEMFDGFFAKDERDDAGRYVPPPFGDGIAVFVDDQPEDMPHGAQVIGVHPYLAADPHDTGLAGVLSRVGRGHGVADDPPSGA
jgi:long-chain acyl-CoA synthetase